MLHVEVQRGEPHIPVDAKRGVIVVDVHPTELTNVEGRRPTRAARKHTRTHTEKQREQGLSPAGIPGALWWSLRPSGAAAAPQPGTPCRLAT